VSFGYFVRPQADRDIDEIADYMAEKAGLEVGLRFLSDLYETLALLASQRAMGWPCKLQHLQLRAARVFRVSARFENYLIFYQPCPDGIEILRVVQGSRDLETLFIRDEAPGGNENEPPASDDARG
jgi:toxin ParE1/3/4